MAAKPSSNTKQAKAGNSIDYSKYIKKTWVEKKDITDISFSISKIADGKITGSFCSSMPDIPSYNDIKNLTGTINKDIAKCIFSDTSGNKGNIELVFKPNNIIEATVKLTAKSQSVQSRPKEGTFQLIPYNINTVKDFKIIQNQSFMVNLNSWGIVRFVSGVPTASIHIPTVFYLTNKDGDFLYDFADSPFPYSVDVKAVSFMDVNKDGLKDIIIIVTDKYKGGFGSLASVFLQNTDGTFVNDIKHCQEMNNSGNNKDIKTIVAYLSKKF